MSRYDGLIIPRSYSDYLNKTDAATLSQMLDTLGGTMDGTPTKDSNKAVRSGGIYSFNLALTADSRTFTGPAISARFVLRVLFTAALTGSDESTDLTLKYNGTTYNVVAGKDGSLTAVKAHLVGNDYIYIQAYTTLDLFFDGTQFVVMGNPVAISNADYTIYTDGSIIFSASYVQKNKLSYKEITINPFASVTFDINGYYTSFQYYAVAVGQDMCGGVAIGEGGGLNWYNTINANLLPTISAVAISENRTRVTLTNTTAFPNIATIIFVA